MAMKPKHEIISALTSSTLLGMFMLACLGGAQQVKSDFVRPRPLLQYKAAAILLRPAFVPASPSKVLGAKTALPSVVSQLHEPTTVSWVNKEQPRTVAISPRSNVSHLAPATSSAAAGTGTAPSSGVSASPVPPSGVAAPAAQPQSQPQYAYTSSNWSGYLAYGLSYTSVSGTWVVPRATSSGVSFSADATWVGIGGVTSPDLIQAGTDDSVGPNGVVTISAFYEMLPDAAIDVSSLSIAPDDIVSATVSHQVQNSWLVTIKDATSGQIFTANLNYDSSLSTAEWIEEDPSYADGRQIPFDSFGSISMSGASVIVGGASLSMVQSGAQGVAMVDEGGRLTATPSAIGADGSSFTVTNDP